MKNSIEMLTCVISGFYRFVWHTCLQRDEPFTRQLCRIEEAHPWWFWAIFLALSGVCYYQIFAVGRFWPAFCSIVALVFMVWLVGHLIDYIQAHPENRSYPPEDK
jgi:fatty acid desaturase